MTARAESQKRLHAGPWLWSPGRDLGLFGGSALFAIVVVVVARKLGLAPGILPEWGWLVFVVGIDVAHVWSTLFRTYLDREEVARHRLRYFGVPVAAYLVGVALYLHGSLTFWRVLAYLALFHFVRQQVGWVAVYRIRSGQNSRLDRIVDEVAVYGAALYPVFFWHARIDDLKFAWFVQGDFVNVSHALERFLPLAEIVWLIALGAFFVRQLALFTRTRVLQVGKILVVSTTALVWYWGIVATNSDFEFTVTNVVIHGVPYFGLLWAYSRERKKEAPAALGSQILGGGIAAFLGVLLLLAFAEEMAWDRLVWHDRDWLFGAASSDFRPFVLALVVPFLALPQATHYALDGVLWRRKDSRSRPAQRRALGFDG